MSPHLTGRGVYCLSLYGATHAVVDAICAGMLISLWQRGDVGVAEAGSWFILYNILAFGIQPLLGLLVDGYHRPREAALAGCLVTAMAPFVGNHWPLCGVCLAGLGNAVFHLGAGSICLNLSPGRATAPGLFVAPGALGLYAGTELARRDMFVTWPFLLALALLCAGMVLSPPSVATPESRQRVFTRPAAWVLTLILGCIAIRSLVGFGVDLPWKTGLPLALGLVLLVALGKSLGGVLADHFGWGRVAVGSLALATPLLAFGSTVAIPAMAGMFLINLTMPVTLAATANLLPGRPAFAFGLTCLALELGSWPVMLPLGIGDLCARPWVVFGLTFGAALALYSALKLAFRRLPDHFSEVHE